MYRVVAYINLKFLLHSFPGKNKHMRLESSWGRKSHFGSYRFAFLWRAANTKLSSTIQCQNLRLTLRVNCYVDFSYVGNFILYLTVLISRSCKLTKTFWNNFVEAHCGGCGLYLRLSQSSQICLGVSLKIPETNRALQSHRCFWKG